MRLLVFAHRAEALTFIKVGGFKSVESATNDLYLNDRDYLLICGEGIYSALEMTSTALAECSKNIDEVLNFGIAGSLDRKLELDEIYEIRTSYAQVGQEVEFKSFSTKSSSTLDCITSSKRVLDKAYAEHLSCFANIVDREAWAVARAANLSNKPFRSFKLISDIALDNTSDQLICDFIKEKAEIFSDKLWKYFLTLDSIEAEDQNLLIQTYSSLYFTVSQFRQYKNILNSLLSKYSSEKEILELCDVEGISILSLTEKQRAQKLLDKMREYQTPFNHLLNQKLDIVLSPLKKSQLNIKLSKDYESDTFSFSGKITNEADLQSISSALKKFDYQKYKSLLRGEFDV